MAGTYKDTIRNKQQQLIRKALDGSVFLASTDAETVSGETLFDADGKIQALPNSGSPRVPWEDLGWLSSDGAQFAREVENSEITSWGSTTPTRTDLTSDTSTLEVAAQETKLLTIGLATGTEPSTITPNSTNSSVEVKKPTRPSSKSYRVLSVAVDEYESKEIYVCRYFPQGKVTSFSEQAFGGGDEPILWGATFTGEEDSELGFSESWIFGGPGWNALLADMGFGSGGGTTTSSTTV